MSAFVAASHGPSAAAAPLARAPAPARTESSSVPTSFRLPAGALAATPAAAAGKLQSPVTAAVAAASLGAVAAAARGRKGARARRTAVALRAGKEISEKNKLRVVIAGGGVGGLVTAKALSKCPNVEVTVLEQAQAFARFGGPIQMASNALSTIRAIDEELFEKLMDRFTFTGCRKNGLVDALRTEWYCPFDAMKSSAEAFALPYTGVVDRPDLQDILLENLPEGTVKNATKVAGYEKLPDAQGVKINLVDGSSVEADVLLGADGIWSATRAQMWNEEKKGPDSGCTYSGYIVFAGETVYQPEDYFDVGYKVYMGPKQYFVTSDVGRGRIQWYAFVGVPEGVAIPAANEDKKAFIRKRFWGWSQQILDLLEATPAPCIEDRALYDRPPSFFKSWADGPVALMGDACHPMMPNLGQGGCQAMEDGYVLTQKLKGVTNTTQIPDLLQEYYRERILRTATVQFLSRIASDLLLDTFTFPWKAEEGLAAPYGKGRGDFSYAPVMINYLRHLLPTIFTAQFSFLYSFHPFKWESQAEVDKIVADVQARGKKDAHEAWAKREDDVEKGVQDDSGAGMPSFFAKVARSA